MERSNLITSINKISVRFLFSALIFARVLIPDPSAAFTAIKVASMQSPNSVEFKSLQAFVDDVETLTGGLLEFRIVTIEENASPAEILEAVNDGEIDAVFLRINSLATKYPETMLFGSPVLGLGLGFDTSSFFSWLHYGGGSELYERMWDEIGLNIKSFILHSSGPNAMGWFAEPFENLEKLQFFLSINQKI